MALNLNVWQAALQARISYLKDQSEDECFRILNGEDPEIKADRYGPVCWYYWYRNLGPAQDELEHIKSFTAQTGAKDYVVRIMNNRGSAPKQEAPIMSDDISNWIVIEHGIKYRLRTDHGLSPGLFLDQRNNRKWLIENSKEKSVLNLFAYTAGFGLAAAEGGARSILNIDTSKANLNWARENAELNEVKFECISDDCRNFLRRCKRKGQKFDIIVCDPPSFARSKKGLFKIQKELSGLIEAMSQILGNKGYILFSTNYESWGQKKFNKMLSIEAKKNGLFTATTPSLSSDFLSPKETNGLKSIFLCKI